MCVYTDAFLQKCQESDGFERKNQFFNLFWQINVVNQELIDT